jgi:hypothetical protein
MQGQIAKGFPQIGMEFQLQLRPDLENALVFILRKQGKFQVVSGKRMQWNSVPGK